MAEQDGNRVHYPILEVQNELLLGGEVDLWSPDPELVEAHRDIDCYPAALYVIEERAARADFQAVIDRAIAASMGVRLD
jgi:hypothetical protein